MHFYKNWLEICITKLKEVWILEDGCVSIHMLFLLIQKKHTCLTLKSSLLFVQLVHEIRKGDIRDRAFLVVMPRWWSSCLLGVHQAPSVLTFNQWVSDKASSAVPPFPLLRSAQKATRAWEGECVSLGNVTAALTSLPLVQSTHPLAATVPASETLHQAQQQGIPLAIGNLGIWLFCFADFSVCSPLCHFFKNS